MRYNSEFLWDNQTKAFKVFLKKRKDGKSFFMGRLNNVIGVTIHPNTSQYAKEGEWQVSFVPIKNTRIEEGSDMNNDKEEVNLGDYSL